jgi:tetratricopeptide (TPR) repeat protein
MNYYRHRVLMAILLAVLVMATTAQAQSPYDDIMVAQGLRNLQAENYDEALVNFKTAWEKGSKTPEKAYYLGVVNYRLTNYPEALKYMERAIYLDPTFNEARLQLAAIYLALDRPAEALPYLQELEAAGYKPSLTAMYLGQVSAILDKSDRAVQYYRQAAEDPLLAQQAKIQASLALSKQDKYSDAQRALQEAISLNPTSREAGFAQRYSDAINRRLEEVRPFHARFGASFDYDSNVTLTPGDAGAANVLATGGRDAVFTQYGNFEYEFFPTGPYGLMASYNLFMTWHPRLTLYDVMMHTFGITPAYRTSQGTLWLPFRFNYTDLDSNKYWTSYTLTPTYLHMVTPNVGLETTLRLVRNYYWWLQPFPQEDRSSMNIGGSLGTYYFYKNQQGYLQARASYEYYGASGSNWASSIYSLLFSALYPITDKLRLNPSLELIYQPFDHPWFNGATYQAKRRDQMLVFGFQVLYKFYKNFDANLHYYYIRDDSNTPLYDYNRQITGLLLEYRY